VKVMFLLYCVVIAIGFVLAFAVGVMGR